MTVAPETLFLSYPWRVPFRGTYRCAPGLNSLISARITTLHPVRKQWKLVLLQSSRQGPAHAHPLLPQTGFFTFPEPTLAPGRERKLVTQCAQGFFWFPGGLATSQPASWTLMRQRQVLGLQLLGPSSQSLRVHHHVASVLCAQF